MLAEAFLGFRRDNAPRLGAALAYYTLFSMAPLLIVAIALAGMIFGQEAAQGQIVGQLRDLLGDAGARALEDMIENSRKPSAGILATTTALFTLFLGATGVFGELKGALNIIWNVPEDRQSEGILHIGVGLIRDRLLSFAMVLAVGFLLLVSLVVSAVAGAAGGVLARLWPDSGSALQIVNNVSSLVVITALFALIFKFLPDTRIAWGDVWMGAALTSILFTAGKYVLGLYLGRSSVASVYGAAGSVIVLIVWVYYAAQIFFFGAELTQAYARRHGSRAHSANEANLAASSP